MSIAEPPERTRWHRERIARLGFLIGQGWDAKRVASDPLIKSEPANVMRQASRFGLSFQEAEGPALRLPKEAKETLGVAAAKRGMTLEAFVRLLAITAAADGGVLISNIVDDGL